MKTVLSFTILTILLWIYIAIFGWPAPNWHTINGILYSWILAVIMTMATVVMQLNCFFDIENNIDRSKFEQWCLCHIYRKHIYITVFSFQKEDDMICILCHHKINRATKLKNKIEKIGTIETRKSKLEQEAKLKYFNDLPESERKERFVNMI